jgi:hypothetical protein
MHLSASDVKDKMLNAKRTLFIVKAVACDLQQIPHCISIGSNIVNNQKKEIEQGTRRYRK